METQIDPAAVDGGNPAGPVPQYDGLARLPFFLTTICIGVAGGLCMLAPEPFGTVAYLATLAALIYAGCLRLANIGSTGWLIILMFLPVANIILSIYLQAYPPGYSNHRQLDTPAKVILGIYALVFIGLPLIYLIGG